MQNKGIVIVTAVLLTLASIFYLSFSAATRYYDTKAAELNDPIAAQDYKDSVKFLGQYTYQKCLETQIGLGLDLKGGMNVILEISVPDVLETLADHKTDADFTKSMTEAKKEEETSQADFISLFIDAWKKNAPSRRLAEIFATQQLQGKVSPQSSDADVEKVLRAEVQAAIDNSFNVVRTRIDKFGVVQPNIQKLEGQDGRIMVEMPGIREPERMRKLLQGSANLEFWETYNAEEIIPYFSQLDARLAAAANPKDTAKTAAADKAAVKTDSAKAAPAAKADPKFKLDKKDAAANAAKTSEAEIAAAKKEHPLLAIMQPTGQGSLSLVAYASVRDTAEITRLLNTPEAKQILPSDVRLLWSATPEDGITAKNIFGLYAIKVTNTSGRAPLEGDVVTDATDQFNHLTGQPEVSMSMNTEGARRWAALTKANVGKAVAIVLDGVVYSAPRVNQEIDGGQSSISGNFTVEMTKDLANTLKSGRMPAPARIVQEEVVGPTLGAQSIQQGIISFIIAFVLLMIYMVLMYNLLPGMMANMALLVNIFFTLGILTSFQAALTMSGIAGMVLSLGTAVDANVLIYERIKEEMRAGKDLRRAIDAGYANAFSAIFDSNLTSIITGVILYVFGTGPIRGFATTWIIGIVCSFFTAVYLTRLIYTYYIGTDKATALYSKSFAALDVVSKVLRVCKYLFYLAMVCVVAAFCYTYSTDGNLAPYCLALPIALFALLVPAVKRLLWFCNWQAQTFSTPLSKNLMQNTAFHFMSAWSKTRWIVCAAVVVFAISFATMGLSRSIDFTGGRNYVVQFEKAVEPEQVRHILADAFPGSNTGALALGTDNKTIRMSTNYKIESNSPTVDDEAEEILYKALKKAGLVSQPNVKAFKNPDVREGGSIISSTKVGPSIAKNITYGAIISVLIALVAIFLYILLRFRNVAFSIGSTVALAFDALVVIGLFSLLQNVMPFSLEIDQTFIGAILTVIGYSINDKVVVFDRIRENLKLHPKQDIQKVFNDSVNQTLARTINTSFSTLIVLLCILFIGGSSIKGFAFAMTLGVIFGTLSSIFVASPVAFRVMGRKIKEEDVKE